MTRMLEAGEDPLYVVRRLVRFASEDIGNADPRALTLALAAKDAYDFLGSPEGELALAQATLFLALAPKSNAAYAAFNEAKADVQERPAEPVPLAHPQRAHRAHEGPRLRQRLPVRARRARCAGRARAFAGVPARSAVLPARPTAVSRPSWGAVWPAWRRWRARSTDHPRDIGAHWHLPLPDVPLEVCP